MVGTQDEVALVDVGVVLVVGSVVVIAVLVWDTVETEDDVGGTDELSVLVETSLELVGTGTD